MNPGRALQASVIVCTYNRAASLRRTLECLARQGVPEGVGWEVIVVDNNSGDGTPAVVAACRESMPYLRYEFEGRQGLSHARNHGIRCARGEVLLFTDDDVCPEPDWVARILAGMEAHQAQACGGYIAPSWEAPPPAWLTERFYGFIALRTDEGGPRQITVAGDAPFGANMAFRHALFEQVGGFDPSRGRKGGTLSSGEDGEMFARILAAGGKVVYLPDARVRHNIEAFRVTRRYFRRWRYQTSRNIAAVCGVEGGRRLWNVPLYLFRQLARAAAHAAVGYLRLPPDEAFSREILVWHLLGLIAGSAQAGCLGGRDGA